MIKNYNPLLCAILFFGTPSFSVACLWEGGSEAYWPTNTIKVCFTNLNESEIHKQTASMVEASLEDLDQQTRFRFYGYGECIKEESDEHQIRISLENRGSNSGDYEVGPQTGLLWPSTSLPLINENEVSENFVGWTTKHDVIHMLGVHHDQERFSPFYDSLNQDRPDLVTFGTYDSESIMLNNEALSEGDLRCLNMIALRRMHLIYDGTQTTTYSDFDTSVTPSSESLYIESATSSGIK